MAVKEWGFEYLKLDFLYSAALDKCQSSYHDPHLTRAQAMQVGLNLVREAAGAEVFILGCGAPLGAAIGRVNANRISCDAGLSWYPSFPLPYWDKWNLPGARSMVRNSINRLGMHNRWWINDPDCILLRHSTHYTDDEVIGIATVKALSGGSIIISDDLLKVSRDRLRIADNILPTIGLAAIPVDLLEREMPEILLLPLDDYVLMGLCNWEGGMKRHSILLEWVCSEKERMRLAEKEKTVLLFMLDFWAGECFSFGITAHQKTLAVPMDIKRHSAAIFAFRLCVDPQLPMYLGSTLHFSCGREMKRLRRKDSFTVQLSMNSQFLKEDEDWGGSVFLYLPWLSRRGSFVCKEGPVTTVHDLEEGCVVKILVAQHQEIFVHYQPDDQPVSNCDDDRHPQSVIKERRSILITPFLKK